MHDLKIAKACPGKNIRPELLRFCSALETDQTREHDQMTKMLSSWYGATPHRDPYSLWIEAQDGELFERYFLKGMLRDHRELADKAGECATRAEHPELAQLCKEVALHREEEARQMDKWNCDWFRQCR